MGSFIHHDRIAEKLEIARTMGLLTKYVISPVGPADRPLASVTIWPSPMANDPKGYLTRLLQGLVAADHIAVTSAFGAAEPLAEADRSEPVHTPEAVAA